MTRISWLAAPGAAALLAGCASLSPDGGFGPVADTTRTHTGAEARWARNDDERRALEQRVDALLARPLDADAAVQLALLNNRGLQARFAELGLADAERVQLGRLPNPGFSFSRLTRGDERELERGLHVDLARLLVLPWTAPLGRERLAAVQRDTALAVLDLAAQARRAWVHAVAAEELLRYARQVQESAEASAELARRMRAVGNWNALNEARQQGYRAEAALAVSRAEQARMATRERLVRLLGLADPARLQLPERLPALPAAARDTTELAQRALDTRLDVEAAKRDAEAQARWLGLGRATRFVNVLDFGVVSNSASGEPRQRGWELSVELPLFDFGQARVAKAEALYRQSLDRAAQVATDARSEVREAASAYRSAWEVARRYRDEVVPLRQRIAEENLLRYNGMLIGVFELLADARTQVAAVSASVEALRDFWLADADLRAAAIGKPALASFAASAAPSATPADAPAGP